MIIKGRIRQLVKGYNMSKNFGDALILKAEQLVKDACRRAEANGRKTVMSKDL